jgi:hypothetical protein
MDGATNGACRGTSRFTESCYLLNRTLCRCALSRPERFQQLDRLFIRISIKRRKKLTGLKTTALLKTGFASIALFAAYPALAQDAAAPAAAPAPAAPAAGASNFSDSDIKQFAAAAVEVTKIQSDTSIADADKQPKMLAALQASGLPPEKFNQIGQAAAADPALQQRIQAAAPPAPAAPATPATPAQPQQ